MENDRDRQQDPHNPTDAAQQPQHQRGKHEWHREYPPAHDARQGHDKRLWKPVWRHDPQDTGDH